MVMQAVLEAEALVIYLLLEALAIHLVFLHLREIMAVTGKMAEVNHTQAVVVVEQGKQDLTSTPQRPMAVRVETVWLPL
jgi:hypothetical protein